MEQTPEPTGRAPSAPGQQPLALTPTLVRAVADKVYALMLRDLRVEHERQRGTAKPRLSKRGR